MLFRPAKNRRRADAARKTGELPAPAPSAGPLVLKVVLAAAATVAVLAGAYFGWTWALTARAFGLKHLAITGNAHATDAELARLGGLTAGVNLLDLDVETVEHALASHPWVKEVRVDRQLPSRVRVEVVEREAVALVSLGELYLVDAAGEPFKRLTAADGLDLPMVSGLERDDFLQRREETVERIALAVEVLRGWAKAKATQGLPLSEVHVGPDSLFVVTEAGQEIALGAPAAELGAKAREAELDQKLARLQVVRGELSKRSLVAQVIRLDDRARPGRVTVELKPQLPARGR